MGLLCLYVLTFYLLQFIVLVFILFVLCSGLLIYFISHSFPALYSYIGSWCFLPLRMIFLLCNNTGLWLPSHHCIVLDYLFISQLLSFLPPHFAHVTVLLFLTNTPVIFPSITESLCPATLTTTLSPHPNHLQQPHWLTPHYWDSSPPPLFPVWSPYWGYRLSFGDLNPEDGNDTLSRKVSKKLPLLAM